MKLKTIALAVAVVTCSLGYFQSSAARRLGNFCRFKFSNTCFNTGIDRTNEPVCNLAASGPVCTVTPHGLGATITAYPILSNCEIPLRITNP